LTYEPGGTQTTLKIDLDDAYTSDTTTCSDFALDHELVELVDGNYVATTISYINLDSSQNLLVTATVPSENSLFIKTRYAGSTLYAY